MPAPENHYHPLPLYTPSTSPSPSDPPPYATGNQASTLSEGRNESIPLDCLPKANQLDPFPLTTVVVEPHRIPSPRLASQDAAEYESRTRSNCLSCTTTDVLLESTPQTWECCICCTSNLQGCCICCTSNLQGCCITCASSLQGCCTSCASSIDACTPVGVSLAECCTALLGGFMNKKVVGAVLFVLVLFLLVSGKITQMFTGNGGANRG